MASLSGLTPLSFQADRVIRSWLPGGCKFPAGPLGQRGIQATSQPITVPVAIQHTTEQNVMSFPGIAGNLQPP